MVDANWLGGEYWLKKGSGVDSPIGEADAGDLNMMVVLLQQLL